MTLTGCAKSSEADPVIMGDLAVPILPALQKKSTESVANARLQRLIQLVLPTIVALRSRPAARPPVARWPSEGGGRLAHTPRTATMPVADAARWRRTSSGEVTLDEVSKLIIEQLQQDGRRSYTAIGKAVG